MSSSVSIREVYKAFGEVKVIQGISMEIAAGEFVVMVGPSGCGKSTLLRMIAGLETITSGEIAIDGRVVDDVEPKERNIAMVFQNYALYPHMPVFDNMAYGLRIRGLTKRDIEERVRRAAVILDVEQYLSRRPRELSGGQRQRVAMGRAEQIGTPDKVYTRPATTFVAGFIGSPPMNLVKGRRTRVPLRYEAEHMHVFDPASGQRIEA